MKIYYIIHAGQISILRAKNKKDAIILCMGEKFYEQNISARIEFAKLLKEIQVEGPTEVIVEYY